MFLKLKHLVFVKKSDMSRHSMSFFMRAALQSLLEPDRARHPFSELMRPSMKISGVDLRELRNYGEITVTVKLR